MKVIQAKLVQDQEDGASKTITALIDHTKKLRVGSKITLKGQSGWWKVVELYDLIRESTEIKTDWDNNI